MSLRGRPWGALSTREAVSVTGRGSAVAGTVLTFLLLGILGAVVFTTLPGSASRNRAGPIPSSYEAVCRADYLAAQTALEAFRELHGSLPTNISQLQPYFQGTLNTSRFSILMNPERPGQLQVSAPGHPAVQGSSNCDFAGA